MWLSLFYLSLALEICSLLYSHVSCTLEILLFQTAYIDNTVHLDPCSVEN